MTGSAIDPEMLYTLLSCIAGFYCLFAVLLLLATRCEILLREQRSSWVKKLVGV